MPVLSPEQVAAFAYQEGLRGERLVTAVAVAGAESAFNTEAFNPNGLDLSYGLWQINMYGSLGPARRARWGISNNEALLDPAMNAKAMASVSGGGVNWSPWTTYTSGAYRSYLDQARTAAAAVEGKMKDDPSFWDKAWSIGTAPAKAVGSVIGDNPITAPLRAVKSMVDLARFVVEKVFSIKFWLRVGQFLLGMFILSIGLYLLFRKQANNVIGAGAKTAAKAAIA